MADQKTAPAASPPAPAAEEGWIDLGPGPGMNEVLRCRKLPSGSWLIATVVIRRGYSNKLNDKGDNDVIDKDAMTRAMVISETDPRSAITFGEGNTAERVAASKPKPLTESKGPRTGPSMPDAAAQQADIVRRTLPPSKPTGFQGGTP